MKKRKKRSRKKKVFRVFGLILVLMVITGMTILAPTIVKALKLQGEAKSVVGSSSYNTFKASQTTVIYDTNGNELCTMSNMKDLYYLDFAEIPTDIVNAFVVMEDQDFYKHSGIDIKGIIRAIIANQKSDYIQQGASTITQQLARNIFLTHEVTWERKIKEAFIAIELEKKYSKDDILEFYLNNIYFANGYYGVEAAARGYFNKSVDKLTLSEMAFLAAIPNSPTKYDPIENFDATLERRNLVLKQMYNNNKISVTEYNAALTETITLNQPVAVKNNYVETYVRHCATESMMAALGFTFRYDFKSEEDYKAYKDSYDDSYALYQKKLLNGGYNIYTSINLDMQQELQKAIDEKLSKDTSLSSEGVYELQGASTCIDNTTGNVVAIVGGRTQELSGYTLNRAYQSYRQPGSSIKPLSVYTPYLQMGNTPDTVVVDEPIEGGPKNADGAYAGSMALRDAVKLSKNTVAWKIYDQLTPQTGSGFLMKLQFKKIYVDKDILAGSLGGFTNGVTTEEMAGGYAALENDGIYRKTTCIITIKNSDGKIIADERYRETKVYDSNAARMMTDMLKTVVASGTGTLANIDNAIVAGKTGTTNSNKDSWFVGYSKYYTTSVWIGYDMPKPISSPGAITCGIWKQFMTAIHKNLPVIDFSTYTIKSTQQKQTQAASEAATESVTQAQPQAPTQVQTQAQTHSETQTGEKNSQTAASKSTQSTTSDSVNTTKTQTDTSNTTNQYGDQDAVITSGDQDAEIK